MRPRLVLRAVIGTLILAAGARAADVPPETQALVAQLAETDFAQREAAQENLYATPWQQHDGLTALAKSATDAETTVRLGAVLKEMEARHAAYPPPVSLHLKQATYEQTAAALSRALGITLIDGGGTGGPITIDADDVPFWTVYQRMDGKRLQLKAGPEMYVYNMQMVEPSVVEGPFRIQAEARRGSARSRVPGGMEVTVTMYADPRVRVLRIAGPQVTWMKDDAGKMLAEARGPLEMRSVGIGSTYAGPQVKLPADASWGKTATIRGIARLEVETRGIQVAIEDVAKHVNEPVTVGTMRVVVDGLSQDDASSLQFRTNVQLAPGATTLAPLEYRLLDGKGNLVMVTVDSPKPGITGSGLSTGMNKGKAGPFTLVLRTPAEVRTVTVPFEIRDVPLPPAAR